MLKLWTLSKQKHKREPGPSVWSWTLPGLISSTAESTPWVSSGTRDFILPLSAPSHHPGSCFCWPWPQFHGGHLLIKGADWNWQVGVCFQCGQGNSIRGGPRRQRGPRRGSSTVGRIRVWWLVVESLETKVKEASSRRMRTIWGFSCTWNRQTVPPTLGRNCTILVCEDWFTASM